MKTARTFLSLLALALLVTACDGGGASSPELKRGIAMIRWMMAPMQLSRSMYAAVQDGKASTFVNYMFSTLGAAEWPPSEEEAEHNPMVKEQAQGARHPLSPKGVNFSPHAPDPRKGKQIVLKADDRRMVVIVEAYDNPTGSPVIVEEIPLHTVKPAAGVLEMAKDAMDSGALNRRP